MGIVKRIKNVRGQKYKSTPTPKNYIFEFSQKAPEEIK